MIRLEGLMKKFGDRQILNGMTLHIRRGETVCLIGGSGTGKSVTLKHIMRLLEPDEGKVIFDGEDISHASGRKLQKARQKMGVLFQSGALLNWLTIGQNVALPLEENTSMSRKEINDRVMETLELLQIPHARDLFPNQISGGMQKRAGLARAVIWKPPCILYDEPTSGLDPVITALVDEMIIDMREKLGSTQVIVTHDMTSAYRTADRIAMLFKGQVVQFGTPDEIRATTNPIVRQFIEGLVHGPITEGMKRVGDEEDPGANEAASSTAKPKTPTRDVPGGAGRHSGRGSARKSARRSGSGSARGVLSDSTRGSVYVVDSAIDSNDEMYDSVSESGLGSASGPPESEPAGIAMSSSGIHVHDDDSASHDLTSMEESARSTASSDQNPEASSQSSAASQVSESSEVPQAPPAPDAATRVDESQDDKA